MSKNQKNSHENERQNRPADDGDIRGNELRDSEMMRYLMDSLDQGKDIGHFGRLVFTMVARFFMSDDELVGWLEKNIGEEEARALVLQVKDRDYNPPKRETILDWQAMQDFPICPNPDDPDACNVYRELRFPDQIYDQIGDFWMDKAEAEEND